MNISVRAAYGLCVLGMIIVGSSISISRLLLAYPTLTGQAIRYAAAAAALFVIARLRPGLGGDRRRPTARQTLILTALGATGLAAFNVCILVGLQHAEPAVVGTFVGAAPLGLALLGPLMVGRRPSARLVAAAGVVVAGTALVQGTGRADAVGLAAAAGALVGEVAFSLLASLVLPSLGAIRVAAYSCLLAVPVLLAGAVVAGERRRGACPALPRPPGWHIWPV